MQLAAGWFVRTGSTWRIVWFTLIAAGVWARPTAALWTFFWARPTAAPWTFFWTPTITGGVLTRWVTTVIFTAWAGASARFPPPVENATKTLSTRPVHILPKQVHTGLQQRSKWNQAINRPFKSWWGDQINDQQLLFFLRTTTCINHAIESFERWKSSQLKKKTLVLVTTVCCLTV